MGAFEYRAVQSDQSVKKGVIQADTARQARSQLRDEGLIPLDVKAVQASTQRRFVLGGGRERTVIFQQLATLLQAGMTLEEVLTVLTDQSDRVSTRRILGAVRARVLEGQSLSQAMSPHPTLFPPLYCASIAAGERTGQLESVLGRLAEYAKQRETIGRGVGLALVYPAFLAVISVAVVTALIGFVVPRIVGVFGQAGQTLPWVTQSLLTLADGLSRYGLGLVVILMAAVGAFIWAWRQPGFRYRVDHSRLHWPGLGRLWSAQQTALMTRTLAILTQSTVPLVEALRVSGRVLTNQSAKRDLESVAQQVSEGVSLSKAVASISWLSGIAKRLIHAGERSGELAPMLEQTADIEERALQSAQSVVLSVIQPVLILVVGLMVLYIVLAIMLPILNMSQLLGG